MEAAGAGVFLTDYIFLAGQDQVDHADQVGFELRLVVGVAPRGIAAGAFHFSEVSEIARDGDQDVVDEDGGISFDAVAVGEFGAAEVFTDKGDAAGILRCDFLHQQTCRVGDVSSVGPADQGDVDGLAGWCASGVAGFCAA